MTKRMTMRELIADEIARGAAPAVATGSVIHALLAAEYAAPKRQLVDRDRCGASVKATIYCQCCGSTETLTVCGSCCQEPLCTACARYDGCPRCDMDENGFAPECSQ